MALIRCKTCDKEFTDKLDACPHCGFPRILEETETAIKEPQIIACPECGTELPATEKVCTYCGNPLKGESDDNLGTEQNQCVNAEPDKEPTSVEVVGVKKRNKLIVPIIMVLVLIVIGVPLLFNFVVRPRQIEAKYTEIKSYMDSGNYVEAQNLLSALPDGEEKNQMQEQIKYESFTLHCIMELKPNMKNPRSLQINEVYFYADSGKSEYPACVIRESGQNGFGGFNLSYSYFTKSDLSLYGTCPSLDESDYDVKDVDDFLDYLTYSLIKYSKNPIDCTVDLNRINKLLSDDVSVNVDITQYKQIIEESSVA